jgi:hypothetical protein
MMDSAAPALKPRRMLLLIKFTSELKFNRYAIRQITPTIRAVRAAICAHRSVSPPDNTATVEPIIRDIEDVGPIATCFEVVKNAKNNPPARQQ